MRLLGAIVWNLVTWRAGLPSSSSHALVGGLVGAAVAAAGSWSVVIWSVPDATLVSEQRTALESHHSDVRVAAVRLCARFFVMGLLYALLRNWKPRTVNAVFGKAQMFSAAGMGLMHGTNDAQKTMGIVALALASGTARGDWKSCRAGCRSCTCRRRSRDTASRSPLDQSHVRPGDGRRHRRRRLADHQNAGAQDGPPATGERLRRRNEFGCIIGLASYFGIPVSTTHNISAAIMGVGAAKRFSALKWTIVERMVWAWLLTIPVSATIAYLLMRLLQTFGVPTAR